MSEFLIDLRAEDSSARLAWHRLKPGAILTVTAIERIEHGPAEGVVLLTVEPEVIL